MRLIGFTGRAQSGKDTAALGLSGWKRIALADPLRRLAYRTDPIVEVYDGTGTAHKRLATLVDRVGWDAAKQHRDVRGYLQRLGSEGVRDVIGQNTWADLASARIQHHLDDGMSVAVTDVRFPNEWEMIRSLGGIVVEIVRPNHTPVGRTHASETDYGLIADATLINDSTIEALQSLTKELLTKEE